MKAVVDRVVQYPHRYQLKNVNTGEVLGTFDLEPITGTISVVGTKIDKELFDSIASDIADRLVSNGGDAKDNVITYTMANNRSNIVSGEKLSVSFGKIAKYFNDLKAVAFSGEKADIGLGNVDDTSDANKPVSTAQQQALNLKANASDVYTKTETDGLLNDKANSSDVYTKTETNGLLNDKANANNVYTKTEADGLLNNKANKSDVYTKSETDNKINKPLYNLGAYDTISGNVITRQTGYVDLWTLEWNYDTSKAYFYVKYPNIIEPSAYNIDFYGVTSKYTTTSWSDMNSGKDKSICYVVGYIRIKDTSYTDVASFKASLQGVILQYELATPYTEEIIEGQPLITLDQQGSQWLRNEWEKGLNLLDYGSRIVNKAINSSGQIIDYTGAYYIKVNLKPNTTYNASGCTDALSGSVSLFTSDGTFIRKIENSNLDSKGNFITDSNVSYALCDNLADRTQPMLVEGDHPYPYQPYEGKTIHEKNITDLYENAYNLGYYDTMVENSDGTYTITRQTGYLTYKSGDLGNVATSTSGLIYFNIDLPFNYNYGGFISNIKYTTNPDIAWSSNEDIVVIANTGAVGDRRIYYKEGRTEPIYIQYKLATATTEKVEKNHYATYNQRFILEHNKSEAERSANLLNTFDRSNIPTASSLYNATLNSDGSYTSTKTSDARAWTYSNSDFKMRLTKGTYYLSVTGTISTDYNVAIEIYDNNNKLLVSTSRTNNFKASFNLASDTDVGIIGKIYNSSNIKIMLNEGTTPLPYQPYEGKVVHEKELESITPGIFTKLGNKTNFSFDSGSYLVVANNGLVTVTGTDPLNVGSSAMKKYVGIFMVTIAEYDGGQSLRVNTEQVFFADYVGGTISGSTFTIYKLN